MPHQLWVSASLLSAAAVDDFVASVACFLSREMQDGCSWESSAFCLTDTWAPTWLLLMLMPYVTSLPHPLVVFACVIIFILLYVGTVYLQAILLSEFQMEREFWVPPTLTFAFGMTSNYLEYFYCKPYPGFDCGRYGGRTDFSPW